MLHERVSPLATLLQSILERIVLIVGALPCLPLQVVDFVLKLFDKLSGQLIQMIEVHHLHAALVYHYLHFIHSSFQVGRFLSETTYLRLLLTDALVGQA